MFKKKVYDENDRKRKYYDQNYTLPFPIQVRLTFTDEILCFLVNSFIQLNIFVTKNKETKKRAQQHQNLSPHWKINYIIYVGLEPNS